jgi:uncharacterized protein (DUF427 family)
LYRDGAGLGGFDHAFYMREQTFRFSGRRYFRGAPRHAPFRTIIEKDRTMKQPSADHPITVTPTKGRVQVKFGGQVIADSTRALTLQESTYPPVQYIPREDAQMAFFESTAHKTHCPYKGDASYFSLKGGDKRAENAVWSYVEPYPAVGGIAGHLAFYPDRVDSIEVGK